MKLAQSMKEWTVIGWQMTGQCQRIKLYGYIGEWETNETHIKSLLGFKIIFFSVCCAWKFHIFYNVGLVVTRHQNSRQLGSDFNSLWYETMCRIFYKLCKPIWTLCENIPWMLRLSVLIVMCCLDVLFVFMFCSRCLNVGGLVEVLLYTVWHLSQCVELAVWKSFFVYFVLVMFYILQQLIKGLYIIILYF